MKCPRCQQDNPPRAKFCLECGEPFGKIDQADSLAASYTELQQALREALEQQTATSEILSVISQSPTDVAPVFRAVAASAVALCRADDAAIFQVETGGLRVVAHEGSVPLGP